MLLFAGGGTEEALIGDDPATVQLQGSVLYPCTYKQLRYANACFCILMLSNAYQQAITKGALRHSPEKLKLF
jgi:ferredoxin-thioredoxin reductase catalytic subunit